MHLQPPHQIRHATEPLRASACSKSRLSKRRPLVRDYGEGAGSPLEHARVVRVLDHRRDEHAEPSFVRHQLLPRNSFLELVGDLVEAGCHPAEPH